jgi:HK97 family phage portal protein
MVASVGIFDRLNAYFSGRQAAGEPAYPGFPAYPAYPEFMYGGSIRVPTGLPAVTEAKALAIPAYARSEQLIAGTIASLPLKTYRRSGGDGPRHEVVSVLDAPQGPVPISPFAWVERCVTHLIRYQELYLRPIYSDGGLLVGLEVVHPSAIRYVHPSGWGKAFTVLMGDDQEVVLTDTDPQPEMIQVLGPGANTGQRRGEPIFVTSQPLFQVAIAAMTAMGRVFTGPMIRGMVSPEAEDEIEGEEMGRIVDHLNSRMSGAQNAGQLAAVNRHLKITPWEQRNDEAQYAETLGQVTEAFARLLGLPPHLLAMIEKQTSWGTGIQEQNIGLARYTLMPYTSRLETALVRFLPRGQFCEFDYKGLLQSSPSAEIATLETQVSAGILTVDEARAVLNLPPRQEPSAPEPTPVVQASAPVFNVTLPPPPEITFTAPPPVQPPDIHVTLESPARPVTRTVKRDRAGLITEIVDG